MKQIAYLILIIAGIIFLWLMIVGNFSGNTMIPDNSKAKDLQPFMTGLIAPLLTLASALLVIENLQMTTRQNFSNNFFKLLDFHHKIVDGISDIVYGINDKPLTATPRIEPIEFQNEELRLLYAYLENSKPTAMQSKPEKSQKRNFFSDLSWRICYDYHYIDLDGNEIQNNYKTKLEIFSKVKEIVKGKTGAEKLVVIYSYYYDAHREIIAQYMQHLEAIISYIDRYGINEKIKGEHFALLSAQLSNYELAVIAYHYLVKGKNDLKNKIDQIRILNSADFEEGLSEDYQKRFAAIEVIIASYPLTFKGR